MSAYAGDPTVSEAWMALAEEPASVLVDVRTRAEWTFVGVPDLSPLGKEPVFAEWQAFPSMQADEARFVDQVSAELRRRGLAANAPVYFLCRSGQRSASAARAMTAAGHTPCFNVAGGFEGRLDAARHRGTIEGWKAAGLPWVQG